MNSLQLTSIFTIIDDFCKEFLPSMEKTLVEYVERKRRRRRGNCLKISEIITILIWFNNSGMNCFKHFYHSFHEVLKLNFPLIPSYDRFLTIQQKAFIPLIYFLKYLSSLSEETGVYYIDSTLIRVCHNKRIFNHKVFEGIAERGYSSVGWFFGFKLHLIVNNLGQIMSFQITKGNVHDTLPLEEITKNLEGLLFGDKGYLGEDLKMRLKNKGINLITRLRQNMKKKKAEDTSDTNKYLLNKRNIIETIFGKLKDYKHLVHTKYRSITNFFMNILSSLCSYSLNPKKPKIDLNRIAA
jgi:hypothetical protein